MNVADTGSGFVRKHFFINRKMQGRYMLTFLLPMLVMLMFFLFTLYIASQSIITTTTKIIKEEIENRTTTQFQDEQQPTTAQYAELVKGIRNYIRDFSTDQKYKKAVLGSLFWVFGIGIFLIIVQITLLTIFFSHKLAGPLYRFEKVCHSLIEGNYSEGVYLRKGDEMQNLAGLFNDMLRLTKDRLKALGDATDQKKKDEIISSLKL
jgi:nitrogen fixation/metabolism regulation signal transduction histidine kinase